MAKYGNWFENAQNVLAKIANINAAGTTFTGDVTGDVTGQVQGDQVVYTSSDTIDLTNTVVILKASVAATEMTLPAPSTNVAGQRMTIVAQNVSNTCDVDFTDVIGAKTATFTVAGQAIHLVSSTVTTGKWIIASNTGATIS